jgi:hypothetical protein
MGQCLNQCGEENTPGSNFCSSSCAVAWEYRHPPTRGIGHSSAPVFGPVILGTVPEVPVLSAPPSPFQVPPMQPPEPVLPTDSEERKQIPIFSGVLNYFPLAIAAIARVSKRGNNKHNPGQPLHWSRDKSTDHEDCIARHLIDVDTLDPNTGEYEDAQALAWRALAKLQLLEERRLSKPISRASR